MEQETMLKEILNALKVHGEKVDRRFEQLETEMKEGFEQVDRRFEQIDRRFEQVDRRFERIEEQLNHHDKKSNGLRADFHETQGNVNYLLIKNAQHEEKLQELAKQQ